jgi:hypothetical protein
MRGISSTPNGAVLNKHKLSFTFVCYTCMPNVLAFRSTTKCVHDRLLQFLVKESLSIQQHLYRRLVLFSHHYILIAYFLKVHFNIVLTPRSFKWPPDKNFSTEILYDVLVSPSEPHVQLIEPSCNCRSDFEVS